MLILKGEARQLTFSEKLKLYYHLLYCPLCRRFRKQSQQLNKNLQRYTESLHEHPPFTLSEPLKKKIQDSLREE